MHFSWAGSMLIPKPPSRRCPDFSRPARPPRECMARIVWAAIRFRIYWFSDGGPDAAAAACQAGQERRYRRPRRFRKPKKNCSPRFQPTKAKAPTPSIAICRPVMQSLVGIYPHRRRPRAARSTELQMLKARAAAASVEGSRMFNPGWHLSRELKSMLIIAEAVTQERHGPRGKAEVHTAASIFQTSTQPGEKSTTSSSTKPAQWCGKKCPSRTCPRT